MYCLKDNGSYEAITDFVKDKIEKCNEVVDLIK